MKNTGKLRYLSTQSKKQKLKPHSTKINILREDLKNAEKLDAYASKLSNRKVLWGLFSIRWFGKFSFNRKNRYVNESMMAHCGAKITRK